MMKIDGNNDIGRSAYADKQISEQATATDEFKKILKASVDRSKTQAAKIQTTPQPNPLGAIRPTSLSPEAREAAVERLDNLLDLLEQYRDQLADPKVTLRQIAPLLNTIDKKQEQLSALLKGMPDEDGLKDIVHRTLIATSLEVMKFNRGDYIPVY
ncbi:MAG: hypothetical protein JRF36_18330 [Deltaproteobacteria bacterium]|jgi:hypothetical protein|nr:hypothetical protein [Deltaproteobacteria bacterium]